MGKRKLFLLLLLPAALVFAFFVLGASGFKFIGVKGGCGCTDWEKATGEFAPAEKTAYFEGRKLSAPLAALPSLDSSERKVLGEQSGQEKWIEVDLSEQKLRAWEGDKLFLETLISSGKPWTPTVTGEFRIWSKYQYTKMSGGVKDTPSFYYLPNVPYVMYFHNDYALHGTYWHANFGQTMSHGCVNLPTPIAEKLFYWTTPAVPAGKTMVASNTDNPGTRVVIHE